MKNAKTNRTIANVLSHVFLTILSIIWLLPVVWLIMQSFRATPTGAFPKAIIPETWTIQTILVCLRKLTCLTSHAGL